MATKTISIMEDAYEILARKKAVGESFSEVIRRVVGKRNDIMQFAGAWKHISDKEAEDMKKGILTLRKKSHEEFRKKMKRLHGHDLP